MPCYTAPSFLLIYSSIPIPSPQLVLFLLTLYALSLLSFPSLHCLALPCFVPSFTRFIPLSSSHRHCSPIVQKVPCACVDRAPPFGGQSRLRTASHFSQEQILCQRPGSPLSLIFLKVAQVKNQEQSGKSGGSGSVGKELAMQSWKTRV